jgi:putative Ca2+/H+ antiporter (TMEM165/GDT1 family)
VFCAVFVACKTGFSVLTEDGGKHCVTSSGVLAATGHVMEFKYNQGKNTGMDLKLFVTVFVTIFIAELGDKTQLATFLYAANKEVSKTTVFFAASLALVATSALGVLAGSVLSHYVNERYLNLAAALGFIAIGTWILVKS